MKLLNCIGLFVLLAVTAGGCDEYRLTFYNHTQESIKLELDGKGVDEDDIGYVAPGGQFIYEWKISQKDLPINYELETSRQDVKFTIDRNTPKQQRVDIYDDAIKGPYKK